MTAVPTSAATTTINTFKPKVRMLEVPFKGELSVKGGDSMKSRPRRSAVGAPARYFDLSAARPDLPQKVIRAPAGDKVSGKSATLFGYVFAATTCEAFGAEHYFAGYRVKRPKELDIAIWTPEVGDVVEDAHDSSGAATLRRPLSLLVNSFLNWRRGLLGRSRRQRRRHSFLLRPRIRVGRLRR
jgi:hypothetical protein